MIKTQENVIVPATHVGVFLKEMRRKRGITLQHAADAVGCSPSYIHRLENQSRKNPSMRMATQLANLYNVNLEELTGVEVNSHSQIERECQQATTCVKEALALLQSLEDERKDEFDLLRQRLVDAQKSLLYMKSLL